MDNRKHSGHRDKGLSKADQLIEHFSGNAWVKAARTILSKENQSEEEFLGAQAVLMVNGML